MGKKVLDGMGEVLAFLKKRRDGMLQEECQSTSHLCAELIGCERNKGCEWIWIG